MSLSEAGSLLGSARFFVGGARMAHLRLGVNVDHVATLRQARGVAYPDPVLAASLAELVGADQITIHLREDRRHIQDRDLRLMRETVQTTLNLEMAASEEMVRIAFEHRPHTVTLVPEKRQELTTEGGLDVVGHEQALAQVVGRLQAGGIEVSMFIDPDEAQVAASQRIGAKAIELHTGRYCDQTGEAQREELVRLESAARQAQRFGLRVAAGHGLNYVNVRPIVAIAEITELNIGHAIVARAVLVGMERAVREMIELMRR
jgi:pyridoxine 5-phosphate synthase